MKGDLDCLMFYKFQSSGGVNSVHESSLNYRSQEDHDMLRYNPCAKLEATYQWNDLTFYQQTSIPGAVFKLTIKK